MIRSIALVMLLAVSAAAAQDSAQNSEAERTAALAGQLVKSDHWQDRFAVAMLSQSTETGIDAGAVLKELLAQRPDDAHILYRALSHCASETESPICKEDLLARYQAAQPGDGLPFMVDAGVAARAGDDSSYWEAMSAVAASERIESYFAKEVLFFLHTMDRHPNLMELVCTGDECGPNASVGVALGFALAMVDYSFVGMSPCAQKPDLTSSQINHCVRAARLLQQSDQYVNASIGVGMELKLLETAIDDPGRKSQLEAQKQRLEKLARAGQAAQDKLDFIHDESFAREYLKIMAEEGELRAFQKAAEMAGIDADDPPPYCVTRADYDAMVAMIAKENLDEVEFPPICEELD